MDEDFSPFANEEEAAKHLDLMLQRVLDGKKTYGMFRGERRLINAGLRYAPKAQDVPEGLKTRVEARLLAHMAELTPVAEGQHVLGVPWGNSNPGQPAVEIVRPDPTLTRIQILRRATLPAPPSWRPVVITNAAVIFMIILLNLFVLHGAADSRPGQPLYPITALSEQVESWIQPDPAQKTNLKIIYLTNAIATLNAEVTNHEDAASLRQAMQVMAEHDADAALALRSVHAGTAQDQLVGRLNQARQQEVAALNAIIAAKPDWQTRLQCSLQLSDLGQAVPHISQFSITRLSDHVQITLQGTNLVTGAILIMPGAPPVSLTVDGNQAMVAVPSVPTPPWSVGLQNPDGRATSFHVTSAAFKGNH